MENINIPSYFLCPISLQMMKDPVILATGITYDRECIEEWMFSSKKNTCPMTKQILLDTNLTPNHTLRRLIQGWCTLNASYGIERIPTPKVPADQALITKLISNVSSPESMMKSLQSLKSIVLESNRNKKCIELAGGVQFLASIIQDSVSICKEDTFGCTSASIEALRILCSLQLSDASLRSLMGRNGEFVQSLLHFLRRGNYQTRAYAVMLLRTMFAVVDPSQLMSLKQEMIAEIVRVLRDQISQQASKSALNILIDICPLGRNRIKAVDAGIVPLLIELLLENPDTRMNELILVVLDHLCTCAEGRAELLNHGAGIAVVSKKILRVSLLASEKSVRILSSISRFSATTNVVQEMLQVGVVAKLCLVLQVECTTKTKENAKEILRSHSRSWKKCSCIPSNLLSFYPS